MFPPIDNTLRWKSRDVRVGYELVTQLVAVVDGIEVALVWQLESGRWTTWLMHLPADAEQAQGDPFESEAAAIDGVRLALGLPVETRPARRPARASFPLASLLLGKRPRRGRPPETRDAVLEALRSAPLAGMHVSQIAEATGRSLDTIRNVCYQLVARGKAVSTLPATYRLAAATQEAQP